jgi:PadR family transcriptional regulator, regulatory protein PadR
MPKKQAALITVNPSEELILLALSGQRLYGLEIIKAIEDASSGTVSMCPGTVYPTLANMVKKGLVSAKWGDESNAGARRKYYQLTGAGDGAVDRMIVFRKRLFNWASTHA